MAAVSAPAEEPATTRTGRPPSMSAAAAPASHAPLAPPPERMSAVGASSGPRRGSHAEAGAGPRAMRAGTAGGGVDGRGADGPRAFLTHRTPPARAAGPPAPGRARPRGGARRGG